MTTAKRPDPEPAKRPTLRANRVPNVVAVRFGQPESGEDYGVVCEAAAILKMDPATFVREASLFAAHKLLRGRRAS